LNKNIGIIGCGWLGLPLAISLISNGYKIHGSTTSEEKVETLKKEGIIPFLIALSENNIEGSIADFLKGIEILVINVPPKLRGPSKENYVKKMQLLHTEMKRANVKKVIFISSTSVYGDIEGEVTEETVPIPSTASGKQLLSSEYIFSADSSLKTTIIRFGGLIGPNRHPITILSGKQGLSNGNSPINLIHLNDCIQIIEDVISHSWWNQLFNGVYPDHPTKQHYYTLIAAKKGLQAPDYKIDKLKKGKLIRSKSLINVKKFKFTTSV
jgi:nucleoside-diphosphate-sugar epimerase